MGNLCIRPHHAGNGHGAGKLHGNSHGRRPGHSDADASAGPQVSSRGSGQELTRAEVKRARDLSPSARQNNEADYPPPLQGGGHRRRSSVKRERDAAGPALRAFGEADYPPPLVTAHGGKTRRQVKKERDDARRLSHINHDL